MHLSPTNSHPPHHPTLHGWPRYPRKRGMPRWPPPMPPIARHVTRPPTVRKYRGPTTKPQPSIQFVTTFTPPPPSPPPFSHTITSLEDPSGSSSQKMKATSHVTQAVPTRSGADGGGTGSSIGREGGDQQGGGLKRSGSNAALIVDDSKAVRKLIGRVLERNGYQVSFEL